MIEKLEEPVPHSGGKSHSPTQIEMPIVFRSAKSHQQRLEHHVFEILPREDIQKLWQDIQAKSKKIKPTSNLAEHKFPGQNSLDEEKETKLASVYERRRREIWSMIAAEVGISWRLAESLHWALGEQEMARRAKKAAGDDQVRTSETDVGLPLQNPGVRNLEDYRGHYFDTTRPPRLDVSVPQTPPTIDSRLVDSTFANTILGKAAYLTAEGRRQVRSCAPSLLSSPMGELILSNA